MIVRLRTTLIPPSTVILIRDIPSGRHSSGCNNHPASHEWSRPVGTLLNNLFAAPRFAGPLFDHSAASLPSASSVMRSRNARASSDGSPSMEAPVAVMATTPRPSSDENSQHDGEDDREGAPGQTDHEPFDGHVVFGDRMPLRLRWAKSSSTLVGSNKGQCRPQDHTWGRHVSVHAVATSCTLTARRSECSTRRGARHRLPVAWALTS